MTGNAIYAGKGVWGKMMQLLHDAKPDIKRVGVLWSYVTPAFAKEEIEPCYAELNSAAQSLGLEIHIVEITNYDHKRALAEIEARSPGGLFLTSGVTPKVLPEVIRFAVDRGLPTIIDIDWTNWIGRPQPLLAYGPSIERLSEAQPFRSTRF